VSDGDSEEERIAKKRTYCPNAREAYRVGPKNKRKIVDDDDDLDAFVPDAMEVDGLDDDDIGSLSAEEPSSPESSLRSTSPKPVSRRIAKSKLSKFASSTAASSSPASTTASTPKPALGAFGQPLDKGERVKNFTEKNKDRYSWLLDVRDKEGNRPGDENYDPRTLYIPPSAWKGFTAFEKQYW
jgi:DNA mismatch repair protein MSH6